MDAPSGSNTQILEVVRTWRTDKKRRLDDSTQHRSIQEDMSRMMGDSSFSDMLFVCGESQEEVPACRMLVAARSPVLETMLIKAGMVECAQARIVLPEIEGAVMRVCLEFLYTDTIQESSWQSHELSMKVISAAHFFLVPKLVHIVLSHFDEVFSKSRIACRFRPYINVVDLTKAYSYGVEKLLDTHLDIHLHDVLLDFIHRIDLGGQWGLECHKHLCEQGLVHLLQNIGQLFGDTSTIEYARFHSVVRWCSSRLVLQADDPHEQQRLIETALENYLPCLLDGSDQDMMGAVSSVTHMDAHTRRIMKLLAEQLSSILPRVPVILSKIPSLVLCNIIEPLDLLPSSMLLDAYRLQALSKVDMRWDEFGHGEHYVIDNGDFSVISCECNQLQGFARCNTFGKIYGAVTYHWEIVMLTPCEQVRVGFYQGRRSIRYKSYNESLLGDYKYSVALSSDGFVHISGTEKQEPPQSCCDAFHVQSGIRIGVHINNESFWFTIDGRKIGEVYWMDWSSDRVYPAISMQNPGKAQVRFPIGG